MNCGRSSAMFEQFNMLSVQESGPSRPSGDAPTHTFFKNCSAPRVNTDIIMAGALRQAHPGLQLTIVPQVGLPAVSLLGYAQATGEATFQPIIDSSDPLTVPVTWRLYSPPALRLVGDKGNLSTSLKFGKFSYSHAGREYILYVVDGRDGTEPYPQIVGQYLLYKDGVEAKSAVDDLIRNAGYWSNTLHGEIWVFDQGYWQKEADLWRSIAKSRWEDVILAENEKNALRDDVRKFFDGQERYERYRVAWKRGVIYYGPPGNGKTISIKALSNELYHRDIPIPTLYVKSLAGYGGPEFSVQQIFNKARAEAPCLLIFEDLDSLITDEVRSYFLNEVDGLNTNQGVYMIGSTNYLERLDPGLSKRPSRFDRKFNFPKPDEDERVMYCEYWRHKLQKEKPTGPNTSVDDDVDNNKNKEAEEEFNEFNENNDDDDDDDDDDDLVHISTDDLEFPKELSYEIAKITDGFSFAYMQEAFVATLLSIASLHDGDGDRGDDVNNNNSGGGGGSGKKDKFDDLLFWRVIKKQIALLKDQI